jgi:hypothetical protein
MPANSDYEYSNCRMILMKIDLDKTDIDDDGDNLEVDYIKGDQGDDRDLHLECDNLKKGEYYVYVEMDWNPSTEDTKFCVTCYGHSNSAFVRDEKELFDKTMVLGNAFRSKAFQE